VNKLTAKIGALPSRCADLVHLGIVGPYERVAAFVRAWKADRQHAMQNTGRGILVPLVFHPGEATQFDWSEEMGVPSVARAALRAPPHLNAVICANCASLDLIPRVGSQRHRKVLLRQRWQRLDELDEPVRQWGNRADKCEL